MTRAKKPKKDDKIELATYDEVRNRFRYHWMEGRHQAKEAAICINGMVMMLHEQNPEMSIYRITRQIWIENEDLEGFSRDTIYRNLDENNRKLLGDAGRPPSHKQNNVLDESFRMSETNLMEESSIDIQEKKKPAGAIEVGLTQEDIDAINSGMYDDEEDEEDTSSSSTTTANPSLTDQIFDLTNEKIKLKEELKEANKKIEELRKKTRYGRTVVEEDEEEQLIPLTQEQEEELEAELHAMGYGEFGETGKTLKELEGDFYGATAKLFKALTQKDISDDSDQDFLVEYLRPTREFRKGLTLELSERTRIMFYNRLHNIIEVAEDFMYWVEEANKK